MAERGQSARPSFRRIKTGEQLAGYTVIEIGDEKVVVDYQGTKTTIDVYQSANSVPRGDTRSPTTAQSGSGSLPSPPQPQASSIAASSSTPAAAKTPVTPSSPEPGVRMTIEGNRRRMERSSPFGPQVWYEDIQK
jgi:hypothetical protein